MNKAKIERLRAAGWRIGSVDELLGLTPAESALIEMKLGLAAGLRDLRTDKGLSQVELAELMESSQSRVAKMEAGDPSVSMDLLVRALLVLGASRGDVAQLLGRRVA